MTNDQVIALLCEFFMDEFREDAFGVSDWLEQGGNDAEKVYAAVERLQEATNDKA